jgi:hypothetical protein
VCFQFFHISNSDPCCTTSKQLLGLREVGWSPSPVLHSDRPYRPDDLHRTSKAFTSHAASDCEQGQIDRHNSYRQLTGLFFPHHEDPTRPLRSTIVDGELVVDVDPHTNMVRIWSAYVSAFAYDEVPTQRTLRLLAFDCLVVDDQNVMQKTLDKRYGVCFLIHWNVMVL